MADHHIDLGARLHAAVGAKKTRREIQADHAAGGADGRQLAVGQIPRRRAQRVGVGMRRHQGRLRQTGRRIK